MMTLLTQQRLFLMLMAIGAASITLGDLVAATATANSIPPVAQRMAKAQCSPKDLSRSQPPFQCVTPEMFTCLKRNNKGRGGSLNYQGGNSGDIVVKSDIAGTVAFVGFQFNASNQTLDLAVKKRNLPVRDQQIWDGVKDTLSRCRQNPSR